MKTALAEPSGQARHDYNEFVPLDRLGNVRLVAGLERLQIFFISRVCRQSRRGDLTATLFTQLAHLADETVAVLAWHREVRKDYVRPPFAERREPFSGGGGGSRLGPTIGEGGADTFQG